MKLFTITTYLLVLSQLTWASISVDNILSAQEIKRILQEKDLFGKNKVAEEQDPWNIFAQEYTEYFLQYRTQLIGFEKAIDLSMKSSFALAYGMEQLIRADLGQHEALGNILPSIYLRLGDGSPIGISEVFSGLFGFLFPQNWIKLKQSSLHHDIAKAQLTKAAFDDYLNIKLVFLDLHQHAIEAEILSFYLSHMQLLERLFRKSFQPNSLLIFQSIYADLGLKLSEGLGRVALHHNNLATALSLLKDENENYSVSSLRINLIENFPNKLQAPEQLHEEMTEHEGFVQRALDHSIELSIVAALAKAAQYNIGISAFGNILSDNSSGVELGLALKLGYDTIPRILTSQSKYRSSQIDIASEMVNFLDSVRTASGSYRVFYFAFIEANNSVRINRILFYDYLNYLLTTPSSVPDEKFILYFENLVKAEIASNLYIHHGLRSIEKMKRYLLFEKDKISKYLPHNIDIDTAINKLNKGAVYDQNLTLREYLKNLRKTSELNLFLSGQNVRTAWLKFGKLQIKDLVKENLDLLIKSKLRSRRFFKTLRIFINENEISLSHKLKKKLNFLCHYPLIVRWLF